MKRYIRTNYYDEYSNIISLLKSAQTYEDMKEIDNIIQNSIYARDARKGRDSNNNYMSLQLSWSARLKELGL